MAVIGYKGSVAYVQRQIDRILRSHKDFAKVYGIVAYLVGSARVFWYEQLLYNDDLLGRQLVGLAN